MSSVLQNFLILTVNPDCIGVLMPRHTQSRPADDFLRGGFYV